MKSFVLVLQCAVILGSVDCVCDENKCKLTDELLDCRDRSIYKNCLVIEQYLCKVPEEDDKRMRFERRITQEKEFIEYLGCVAGGKLSNTNVSVIWLLVPFLLFVVGFTLSFWFQRGGHWLETKMETDS
ncbi:uncharacterized protein LOC121370846 [Gigantopelta aegis]|uniref:uncharacterized protein LOC121370846 n=1 Tax=Gigantopelta aegis TaxID=1735272 RepID=UPI001B88D6AD|nr:uncharacterized protein LOC121370846 [Gigantopelta aegis]